jgi:hypothetical protein
VVAACGDEYRLIAVAGLLLEPEDVTPETERALDVADFEVHVTYVHTGIDRAASHPVRLIEAFGFESRMALQMSARLCGHRMVEQVTRARTLRKAHVVQKHPGGTPLCLPVAQPAGSEKDDRGAILTAVSGAAGYGALRVPDRFESLRNAGGGSLLTIVAPVEASLAAIDHRFTEMSSAGRGGLMVLNGPSGAGKSTFLDTVGLFRQGVVTETIGASEDVREALERVAPTASPRILVLEGREALRDIPESALEASMHAINSFARSDSGCNTLVVWPTNTQNLTKALGELGERLGAEALFGTRDRTERFTGPHKSEYVNIASRTVAALNEGASLTALGVSESEARLIAEQADTIGRFLGEIRQALIRSGAHVLELLATERCRVWTVVVSGPDAEGDVAALTRGGFATTDIDRLMTATAANIVKDLKEHPQVLGILGTVLDSRIAYLDMVSALEVAREFGDDQLHRLMQGHDMSVAADGSAVMRLQASELGVLLAGRTLGTKKPGPKPGSNTQKAFLSLTRIARQNDVPCNRALGRGLAELGLIADYETERDLDVGTAYALRSDLYCDMGATGPIRLEFMWRAKGGRADIANYVLTKLGSYGKAIGLV